ncbi:MAG: sensor histidine kinase [Pirellulales bacterium]
MLAPELPPDDEQLRGIYLLQEQFRRLLAYDLHDGLVQDLVAAKLHAETALAQLDNGRAIDRDQLQRVCHLVGKAVAEGRRLVSNLRPLVLDEQDLVAAIDYLVQEWAACESFHIEVDCDGSLPHIDLLTKNVLYRIVQEGLTNAFRHSGQSSARVAIHASPSELKLIIADHGHGFDHHTIPPDRLGLIGIRDRARLLRGQAQITSRPGEGTTIEVRLPLPRHA